MVDRWYSGLIFEIAFQKRSLTAAVFFVYNQLIHDTVVFLFYNPAFPFEYIQIIDAIQIF